MRKRIVAPLVFWMLTSCWADTAKSSAGEVVPGLRNGLLFQPRGQLTLATGVWTTVVRFRQSEIQAQADTIRQQLKHIDQALDNESWGNTTSTAEGIRGRKFVTEVKRMWQQERDWMEAEVREGENDIYELRTELSRSRRARGLINALGDGLKWLFGTATEGDIHRLHKDLKGVEVGLGKLRHIADLQTTLIGSLSRGQKRNAANLVTLARKAIELEQSLAKSQSADHLTMKNIRQEVDFSQAVSSAIRTASAAVMAFRHEVARISRAMEHTQQGAVTPIILSPATLRAVLSAITAHLPEGWVSALPLSETPSNFYKFLRLAAVPLEDGWEVHIQIPLRFRSYSQFHLYEVIAIPQFLPNSTAAFLTQIPSQFFAISGDQRLHLEVDQDTIERCQQAVGRTVCRQLTPLIREKREGCLYHSFRDDQTKAAQVCKRKIVKPRPSVHLLAGNKWAYTLPNEETFSMQCTGQAQPTSGFRLKGAGVFSLPAGCAAMGDSYIVPAHLYRTAQRREDIRLSDMTHFKIELDVKRYGTMDVEEGPINDTILQRIVETVPTGETLDATLAELQEKVHEERGAEDEEVLPIRIMGHISLSLGTANTLLLVGLIIYSCKKGRRGRDTEGVQVMRHLQTTPPVPLPTAPFSEFQARLTHLEANTRQLQAKMEQMEQHEAALRHLEGKYKDLMATLM